MDDFGNLSPNIVIDEVEKYLGTKMCGLCSALPSYINRVYNLQCMNGTGVVAKFYRPGRWSKAAIEEEHRFVADCAEIEIPVIMPLPDVNGKTLRKADDGTLFTVFPRRFGREMEIIEDEDWRRLGRVTARIHLAGAKRQAKHRVVLTPEQSTMKYLQLLQDGNHIATGSQRAFAAAAVQLLELTSGQFDRLEKIRIHGDCHRGNILERPGEGLMIIDFDDMMHGPPIQDLWLLLPGYANECRRELDLLLEGYFEMREFDISSLALIESLRAMRQIYFLAWCSTQTDDFKFKQNFPDWGSEQFWHRETADLQRQLQRIVCPPNLYN